MYLLVPFEIIGPRESPATLRALVRLFTLMSKLMVLSVKVARESLPAQRASMVRLTLDERRIEFLGEVAHIRMKCSGVLLKVLLVGKTFYTKAIQDLALEWSIVVVDMPLTSSFLFETFRKEPACDLCAFEPFFLVIESVVCGLFAWTRFTLGEPLEYLAISFQSLCKTLDTNLMACFKALLLKSVDMTSELHKVVVQVMVLKHTATCLTIVN